jgi:hypothetical protein
MKTKGIIIAALFLGFLVNSGKGSGIAAGDTLPSSLTLNFDSLADFTLIFDPWTTVDVGGGFTYGIAGISFPHATEPMAYICFNPATTSPPEQYMKPYTGKKLGCCFSSTPPYNPNNKWLITPKMKLANNPRIEFWVQTYNIAWGLEMFNVAVSTTDNNPDHFERINTIVESAPATWTRMSYLLDKYAGKEVYIGIQCISNNTFIFMIDDISITSVVGIGEEERDPGFSVYPNPASGELFLRFDQPEEEDITAELINTLGETVRTMKIRTGSNPISIDISGLNAGVYYLRLKSKSSDRMQKICITN